MAMYDKEPFLETETEQCPRCHQDFALDTDSAPTYLSCGHSVCFKCIQVEWCRSESADVDMITCPLCTNQILICFDKEMPMKIEEQPLESARNNMTDVLRKAQLDNQISASLSSSHTDPGSRDVLMIQTANKCSSPLNPVLSESTAMHMDSEISFPILNGQESGDPKSWTIDVLNLQALLEKETAVSGLTDHMSQDSMFADHGDSDISTVQDLLKIVNIPGDSLFDENSLSSLAPASLLDETSNPPVMKNSLSNFEISELSQFLHPPSGTNNWQMPSSCQEKSNLKGVDIHVGEENDPVTNDLQPFSVDQRGIFETLEGHSFVPQAQGRRQAHHNKGRKTSVLSRKAEFDSLYLETMTAVASIEGHKDTEKSATEKIPSMKESLYKRFYPKSSRKLYRRGPALRTEDRSYSSICQEQYPPSREEIDIPDMQMVKIVSDVQIPEEEASIQMEEMEETSRHNYGYVKNSMLPNGNEIKNLYVVPKTWLNNDEVEVQFTPTETEGCDIFQPECSMQPEQNMQKLSDALAYPMTSIMPSQHSLLQPFSRQQISMPKAPRLRRDTSKCRSAVEHTVSSSKPVRICPKIPESGAAVQMIQTADLNSGESPFETEMVHVRYEINDGQIVFIPEPDEESSHTNTTATERYCDKEQGPLLILTVQDSESSDSEKCKSDDRNDPVVNMKIMASLRQEKPDTHAGIKSVIQPKCFGSATLQGESERVSDKILEKVQDLHDKTAPTTTSAERVISSVSLVPSASSSTESCRRAFSSPESVTPEDIQGWHMSQNNSTNSSRCELISGNENHEDASFQVCSDSVLHDSVLPCHCKTMDNSPGLVFNTVPAKTVDSGELQPDAIGGVSQTHYKDSNVSDDNHTTGNDPDVSSATPCSFGTGADGVDYGSPPELERMVRLPPNTETNQGEDRENKSVLECVSSTKVLSSEIFSEEGLRKQDKAAPPQIKAEKSQLEVILGKLAGLNTGKNVSSDIKDLSYQIEKLNVINQKFNVHTGFSFYNNQSKKIYDMIINQVSSLIACEMSVQCFDDNADVLGKATEKEMCTQRYLFRQVVKQGIGFITELINEYEMLLDTSSTGDNELEVSSSGLKDIAACEDEDSNTDGDAVTDRVGNTGAHGNGKTDYHGNENGSENGNTDLHGDAACVPGTDDGEGVTNGSHWEHDICQNDQFQQIPENLPPALEVFDERSSEPHINELNSQEINKEGLSLLSLTPEGIPIPQKAQDLPHKDVTSETSLVNHVSDIALNVEIGTASSNESLLPSLSEIMRIHNHQDKKETPEDTKTESVTLRDDTEISHPQYFRQGKENSDSCEDKGENDDEEGESHAVRSPRKKQQDRSRKRKRQGQDVNGVDTKKSKQGPSRKVGTDSTPTKKRQKSLAPGTPAKSPGPKSVKGKKKKVKKKDIYASSSEEIIPPPIKRGFQYTDECFKIFNTVYNHKKSDPFCKEIKSDDVPGYYKVVKRAMWLDLIAHKLRSGRYERLEDYVADMRLVFSNSHLFNKDDTELYESGIICEKLFEKKLAEQFPDKQL
ncbi:uncharacterized protein [Haliotis asinina]|uniref:uncharacterized protein n=1 Tax=Haliotis asinina TaxID=109174 RepID=UPI0035324F08